MTGVCGIKLSICIATLNRGKFLAETLASIVPQLAPGVEIVVVDGASTDETSFVVNSFTGDPRVRYFREAKNSGVDEDFDKAVSYATGEFCWLMSDDDLLYPGAVSTVLSECVAARILVVPNADVVDFDLVDVYCHRLLNLAADIIYEPGDDEALFTTSAKYLTFIGGVVIRRSVWMQRDRQSYWGTLFAHVGVIFQQPLEGTAKIIARPLIKLRYGNSMWTRRAFEIWMFKWPALVWSLDRFSKRARQKVSAAEPWSNPIKLGMYRALGAYSLEIFHSDIAGRARGVGLIVPWLVAMVPAKLANSIAALYCLAGMRMARVSAFDLSRSSNATFVTRAVARRLGVS